MRSWCKETGHERITLTFRRVRAINVAVEKHITYSECVFVALSIQHAMRTRRIIPAFVTCTPLHYFSKLSHKRHDFRKKKNLLNVKCVLIFAVTFV